ncbi:MAG TPA: hypothetical protein VKG01_00250 [Thermoanaerobaculia bacterium]|nr:hypothetical protein [Thermoanaerobaculia bacterium]
MKTAARVLLVLALAGLLAPAVSTACPLCKEAKSDTDYPGGAASLPKGFYYSILLMVGAPFAVVGGLGLKIFLARRRALAPNARPVATRAASGPAAAASRLLPDSRGAQP